MSGKKESNPSPTEYIKKNRPKPPPAPPSVEGKHPGGRPTKYKAEYDELVFLACSIFGADDIKLAKFIGITKATLNTWKKEYPVFMDSLKRGKDLFDCNVAEKKLYSRVEGYNYIEKTTEAIVDKDGKILEIKKVKNVTKHVPPDVGACFGWLYNRNRARWKNRKALELTGEGGGAIKTEGLAITKEMSAKEAANIYARMIKEGNLE